MTYEEFRKAYPATRNRQSYTLAMQVERWSTPLKSKTWRNSTGEFFYTHEMLTGKGYPTAKAATSAAYEVWLKRTPVRIAEPAQARIASPDEDIETTAAEQEADLVLREADGRCTKTMRTGG